MLLGALVLAVVIGGGAFYGGMKYEQSKLPAFAQNFRNNQLGASVAGSLRTGRAGNQDGSGFANGSIIAKDDKSLTLQLRDGGSKIVFLSDAATVKKSVDGTLSDLVVGENVTVNGSVNADGSITAQSISLQPDMPSPSPTAAP